MVAHISADQFAAVCFIGILAIVKAVFKGGRDALSLANMMLFYARGSQKRPPFWRGRLWTKCPEVVLTILKKADLFLLTFE